MAFSDFRDDKSRMDNWRGFLNEGHDCASHEGQTHEEWKENQLEETYVDPNDPSQDSDDDLSELMRLIREEIEVVLSDAEAKEFFGEDALEGETLDEKKLTSKERKGLGSSTFVFPKERKFPIPDESHARNALSRANQYSAAPSWYDGTLQSLVSRVHSAVKKKFPGIDTTKASEKPGKG